MSEKHITSKYNFDTGDILLFHNNNNFSSWTSAFYSIFTNIITFFTQSKYSHIGIIIKDPQFTTPPKKGLYLLESSCENIPDSENNEYKIGVQLQELDTILNEYINGQVYWRKLNCIRDKIFYTRLAEAHNTVHNRPYDVIPTDWLKAVLHINTGNIHRKKTFWCSALVAYIYVVWGFLKPETPWTLVSPKMLGTESNNKHEVEFINCTIDKEIQII